MQKKNIVSNQQIKDLLVTTVVGVGVLSLPSSLAVLLDNDGWIAIILGGLLLIPFIIMIDKVFKMYPNKTIFQIGREVVGNIIFNIFFIIFIVYVVVSVAYLVRIFGEVIKAYLLETTPIEVIIITMLLAAAYLSRSEIEVLGRTATMVYPVLIGLIVFLIVINVPEADFTNMLPTFTADFRKLPQAIMTALFSYSGYEIIVFAYSSSDNKQGTLKYALRGLFVIIGIYLIVHIVTLSQFGVDQLKREIWPTIAVASVVDLPGYFLENLDGVVLALWVMIIYASIGPVLYTAGRSLADIFKVKSHDMFILPLIPIIYIVSLIPENIVQVNVNLGNILGYATIVSIMVIPTVIYIAALIKKRRSKA